MRRGRHSPDRDGLVTGGSRMLQPRDGGRRMENGLPKNTPSTYTYTQTLSSAAFAALALARATANSTGFTIVQVFTGETPRPCFLIKSDICSGTVAKSHGGERDLEGWGR